MDHETAYDPICVLLRRRLLEEIEGRHVPIFEKRKEMPRHSRDSGIGSLPNSTRNSRQSINRSSVNSEAIQQMKLNPVFMEQEDEDSDGSSDNTSFKSVVAHNNNDLSDVDVRKPQKCTIVAEQNECSCPSCIEPSCHEYNDITTDQSHHAAVNAEHIEVVAIEGNDSSSDKSNSNSSELPTLTLDGDYKTNNESNIVEAENETRTLNEEFSDGPSRDEHNASENTIVQSKTQSVQAENIEALTIGDGNFIKPVIHVHNKHVHVHQHSDQQSAGFQFQQKLVISCRSGQPFPEHEALDLFNKAQFNFKEDFESMVRLETGITVTYNYARQGCIELVLTVADEHAKKKLEEAIQSGKMTEIVSKLLAKKFGPVDVNIEKTEVKIVIIAPDGCDSCENQHEIESVSMVHQSTKSSSYISADEAFDEILQGQTVTKVSDTTCTNNGKAGRLSVYTDDGYSSQRSSANEVCQDTSGQNR